MAKKNFHPINLPCSLVEDLKLWRKAFSICYPTQDITYEFMIRQMLDCLELSEPAVYDEYRKLFMLSHPEFFKDEELVYGEQ